MAELAYAYGLGPYPLRVGGSTPLRPTQNLFMKSTINKQDDGTIKLKISLAYDLVDKTRQEIIKASVKQAEISGFRKGKAPETLVEKNLDEEKIKEEILKKLLPKAYADAVKEHDLNPILTPKIHVAKFENNKDWDFEATTCEAPKLKLNGYKEKVKALTSKSKIIIPGKKENPGPSLDDVVKVLLENVSVKLPDVLVEQETDRLLAQILDEIKKLGLSLDQYLASTKKTAQQLRETYDQKARADLTFELALQKIAKDENISVEEKEIDEAIQKAKDENERKNLEQNRYLLAQILRQQKTLDFIKNL